jgi:hypothetical protein
VLADLELGGVHAHRKPAGSSGMVIASQGALAAFIELAVGCESQRVSWDHQA